ncbi:MAG: hypothetical protein JXJ20_02775 [Anaerolineae bacterium]|nr:hypothetical protein [Anaerolineae bacterium]
MDISLITSLYRAETHLEAYRRHVLDVAAQVQTAGLALELILVANEPTDGERLHIRQMQTALEADQVAVMHVIEVKRETVYASWNRGMRAASGACLGPWNVDDVRTADALIEGQRLIAGGCDLVYFPYHVIRHIRLLGRVPIRRRSRVRAQPYNRDVFTRSMRGASFLLFARDLYQRVGPFDEHFRISGDFEWCVRVTDITDFCRGTQIGGTFTQHGGNLSDVGDPLQAVERNIIHLRRGVWQHITPADPDLMRACWTEWGDTGATTPAIPAHITALLWGENAADRWQRWLVDQRRARRRVLISEALRAVPRCVINRAGLRPLLARLGVVKSATVDR